MTRWTFSSPIPPTLVVDGATLTFWTASAPRLFLAEGAQLAVQFQRLTSQWESETAALSSATQIARSEPYLKIIAMGKPAVPLIAAQLREEADQPHLWFRALELLTGQNPVPASDRGDLQKMSAAWLRLLDSDPSYGE